MPTISEEEVSLVTDEWKVYQAGDIDSTTRRVDHYCAEAFKEKSLQGEFKYSILQKLIKSLLSLAHGNADVERSLSANKKTVTPDRASLGDLTINGLRAVKDRVRVCGAPHKVEITKGLLRAANKAHKAYSKRLSDEKEQLANKNRSEEVEKQRLRDAEKEREREAEKLEKSRANLAETEQKLMKSEKHKESELQAVKILYDEAKDRLSEAIKNKNFNRAPVAQGLLEVAEKKMEQTRMCSSKRTQLDTNKKRLLEDYSKHVSAKMQLISWIAMAVDLTAGPEFGLLNFHFFNICRHHPTLKFKPHATDDERYVWGIDGVPLRTSIRTFAPRVGW